MSAFDPKRTCEWGCADFGVRMRFGPRRLRQAQRPSATRQSSRWRIILPHAVGFGPTSKWLGRCGVVIPGLRQNQDLRLRKLTGQSGTGVGNV